MTTGVEIAGLTLPAEPPSDCETIADPVLDKIGQFVAGVWRRHLGSAWESIAPNEPIVRKIFTHDPEEYEFHENDLPALYVFATGSARPPEQIAEDIRISSRNIRVFWVFPWAQQQKQARRAAIRSSLANALDSALERTRDPGWIVTGDTDPLAAREGSSILKQAELTSLKQREWAATTIAIAMKDGTSRKTYPCLSIRLETEEQIVPTLGSLVTPVELDLRVTVEGFEASRVTVPIS